MTQRHLPRCLFFNIVSILTIDPCLVSFAKKILQMNKKPHVVEQPNQKGLNFYIDKKQAKKVFDLLIKRLSEKGPPYNEAQVPQADQFLPTNLERGSVQHAIFLFMLCLWMRAGTESDTAASFLKSMYEKRPLLFDPSIYKDEGKIKTRNLIRRVKRALIKYRLSNQVDENAPAWVYNMRKLDRFWNGDPRTLMNDTPDFKTLTKRITGKTRVKKKTKKATKKKIYLFFNEDKPGGFMFFEKKMTSMIVYFLMDAKLVPMFYTPVPVDFHILRLCTANLVIRVQEKSVEESVGINFGTETVKDLAREATEWYCRTYQISPLALADSLWLLSRTLCRNNPGNSGYVVDKQRKRFQKDKSWKESFSDQLFDEADIEKLGEPEGESDEDVEKGRKRYFGLKWEEEDLLKPSKVRRFEKSCGRCPLNKECCYNISAGSYYVKGGMLPERFRFIPPTHPNFFDDGLMEEGGLHRLDITVRFTEIILHA